MHDQFIDEATFDAEDRIAAREGISAAERLGDADDQIRNDKIKAAF